MRRVDNAKDHQALTIPQIPPVDPDVRHPKVSVIIPTHNRSHLVERAISSVLAQSFVDLELIVVDDASQDATAAVVRAIDDGRVYYLRSAENLGVAASRNIGLANARGEFVGFLDDDDAWHPKKLERQLIRFSTADPEVGVMWCYQVWIDPEGRRSPRRIDLRGNVLPRLLRTDIVMMQPCLVRRSCFEDVGGFDPTLSFWEDFEMSLRLAAHCSFETVPEELVVMHSTPGSMSTDARVRIRMLHYLLDSRPVFRRRSIRARWLLRIAADHDRLGEGSEWREAVISSIRCWPWSARPYVVLVVGTLLGPSGHARLARLAGRVSRRWRHLALTVRHRPPRGEQG